MADEQTKPGAGGTGSDAAGAVLRAAQEAIARAKSMQGAAGAGNSAAQEAAEEAVRQASTPEEQDPDAAVVAAMMAGQVAPQPGSAGAKVGGDAKAFALPSFGGGGGAGAGKGEPIDLLSDVNLHVKIELGRTRMLVEDVLRLGEGSVVELDKLAGDPVDVYVNDRLVARGEVLVLNDNFCVRVNELIADPGAEGVTG